MIRIDFAISKTVKIVSPNKGFTLMEVLIAVSLSAIIVALVAGAMNVGRSSWEKGSEKMERLQANRWVESVIRRQIGSICFRQVYGKGIYPFSGGPQFMNFLSSSSIDGGDGASLYLVTYKVEQNKETTSYKLIVGEENFAANSVAIKKDPVDGGTENRRIKVLIPESTSIKFFYTDKTGAVKDVEGSVWDKNSNRLPSSVKIEIVDEYNQTSQILSSIQVGKVLGN